MSFERRFFFGCVQKDLEDPSGEEQLAVLFLRRCDGQNRNSGRFDAENDSVVCSGTTNARRHDAFELFDQTASTWNGIAYKPDADKVNALNQNRVFTRDSLGRR